MTTKLEHAKNIAVGLAAFAGVGAALHQLGLHGLPIMAEITGMSQQPTGPPDSLWWIFAGFIVVVFTVTLVSVVVLAILVFIATAHLVGEIIIEGISEVAD